MANGGARPGAGRKPKLVKYGTAIQEAEKRIVDRLPELIDIAFRLAEGVQVIRVGMYGQDVVYREPPDFRAVQYLIDRIMGKPSDKSLGISKLTDEELIEKAAAALGRNGPAGPAVSRSA